MGEPISWKLCSVIKGDANPVDVTYDFTYPNHNGLYSINGISALAGINGLNVSATATPDLICSGDPVELHADAGTAEGVSFTWSSIPAGFMADQQHAVAYPSSNTRYVIHAFDGVFHAYDTVDVAVTQSNPLVEVLPVSGITVHSGEFYCYNATLSITTAGSGSLFQVESGGHVQLIAGQSVRMLPGTRAFAGSHLHAMITTTGSYCCGGGAPAAPLHSEAAEPMKPEQGSFFKVYPNPTFGLFTLDLTGAAIQGKVEVEIYGLLGERILKRELSDGIRKQVFDLSGNRNGVYLIRVSTAEESGMAKIIRQ